MQRYILTTKWLMLKTSAKLSSGPTENEETLKKSTKSWKEQLESIAF